MNAPSGLALFSGPDYPSPGENEYILVRIIPDGTALDVLGRVHNKDTWFKVVVNPEIEESVEGYVNTASGFISFNVKLADIPQIYEFGPVLYEPKRWTAYSVGDNVWFTWERKELKPDQVYSLRVVPDAGPGSIACIHIQVQNPKQPDRNPGEFLELDCPRGAYYWSVVIATKLPEGSEDDWREESEFNHKYYFGIGMPHPNTPPDYEDEGELPPDI